MNPMTDPLLAELDTEAKTTRRVLERVPEAKLAWKPHPKSSSLGQLALHTAKVPGALARILSPDTYTIVPFAQAQPTSCAELMTGLDESVAFARLLVEDLRKTVPELSPSLRTEVVGTKPWQPGVNSDGGKLRAALENKAGGAAGDSLK